MESYSICSHVIGFFQLRYFLGSSMLCVTALHSFLWLNDTTLCVYRCVCIYIHMCVYIYVYSILFIFHQLMDVWVGFFTSFGYCE